MDSRERNPLPAPQTVMVSSQRTSRFDLAPVGRFEAPRMNEMVLPPVPEPVEERRVATSFDLAEYAKQLALEAGSPEAHEYLLQTLGLCGKPAVMATAWAREAVKDKIRCHKITEEAARILAECDGKVNPTRRRRLVKDFDKARSNERRAEATYLARMREAGSIQRQELAAFQREMDNAHEAGDRRTKLRPPNPLLEKLRKRAAEETA